MVTYDSFSKVKQVIGEELGTYKIIIDEYHEILDIISYRTEAIINLLRELKGSPNITYLSATSIPFPNRPEELKNLQEYEIDWGKTVKIKPIRRYSTRPYASVVRIIKRHKSGKPFEANGHNAEEYFFFINSVTAIKGIIQNAGLTSNDVKVICADSYANKRILGDISIGDSSGENKPFTFCTKTVFYGADFYSKSGLIVIVSDGNNKNTMLDIATDIQQIAGRIRNPENPFKNIFLHIYNKGITCMNKTQFKIYLAKRVEIANKKIKAYNTLPDDLKIAIIESIKLMDINELVYYDEKEKRVLFNEVKR